MKFASFLLEANIANIENLDAALLDMVSGETNPHAIEFFTKSLKKQIINGEVEELVNVSQHYIPAPDWSQEQIAAVKPWQKAAAERNELFDWRPTPRVFEQVSHLIHWIDAIKTAGDRRTLSKLPRMKFADAVIASNKYFEVSKRQIAKMAVNLDGRELVYETSDGFAWYRLVSQKAYAEEGKFLQNCIGTYYRASSTDVIYVMKDINTNMSHVGLRLNHSDLREIRGKNNKFPITKYHNGVTEFVNILHKKGVDVENYNMIPYGIRMFKGKFYTNKEFLPIINQAILTGKYKYIYLNDTDEIAAATKLTHIDSLTEAQMADLWLTDINKTNFSERSQSRLFKRYLSNNPITDNLREITKVKPIPQSQKLEAISNRVSNSDFIFKGILTKKEDFFKDNNTMIELHKELVASETIRFNDIFSEIQTNIFKNNMLITDESKLIPVSDRHVSGKMYKLKGTESRFIDLHYNNSQYMFVRIETQTSTTTGGNKKPLALLTIKHNSLDSQTSYYDPTKKELELILKDEDVRDSRDSNALEVLGYTKSNHALLRAPTKEDLPIYAVVPPDMTDYIVKKFYRNWSHDKISITAEKIFFGEFIYVGNNIYNIGNAVSLEYIEKVLDRLNVPDKTKLKIFNHSANSNISKIYYNKALVDQEDLFIPLYNFNDGAKLYKVPKYLDSLFSFDANVNDLYYLKGDKRARTLSVSKKLKTIAKNENHLYFSVLEKMRLAKSKVLKSNTFKPESQVHRLLRHINDNPGMTRGQVWGGGIHPAFSGDTSDYLLFREGAIVDKSTSKSGYAFYITPKGKKYLKLLDAGENIFIGKTNPGKAVLKKDRVPKIR